MAAQKEKMLALQKQNAELLKRLADFEAAKADAAKAAEAAKAKTAKADAAKQGKETEAAKPAKKRVLKHDQDPKGRRRSPRTKKRSVPPSPITPIAPATKKRLTYVDDNKKRNTPETKQRDFRKTLGLAVKGQYDDLIRAGHFLDSDRNFLVDKFEDAVRPIIEAMFISEDVDTSFLTKYEAFRIAIDIAKKREAYKPKYKKNSKKMVLVHPKCLQFRPHYFFCLLVHTKCLLFRPH